MNKIIIIILYLICIMSLFARKSIFVGYCGYSDEPSELKFDTTLTVLKWNDSAIATPYIKPLIDDFAYSLTDSGNLGTRLFDYQITLDSNKQFKNLITVKEILKHKRKTNDCRGVLQYVKHNGSRRDSVLVYVNYDINSTNIINDCFKASDDSIDLYLYSTKRPKPYLKPDSSEVVFIDLIYDGNYNLFVGALDEKRLLPIIFTRRGKRITDFNRNLADTIVIFDDYQPIFDMLGINNYSSHTK